MRLRAIAFGGGVIVIAMVAALVAWRLRDRPLGPDEAIAVVPTIPGIGEGTQVWG